VSRSNKIPGQIYKKPIIPINFKDDSCYSINTPFKLYNMGAERYWADGVIYLTYNTNVSCQESGMDIYFEKVIKSGVWDEKTVILRGYNVLNVWDKPKIHGSVPSALNSDDKNRTNPTFTILDNGNDTFKLNISTHTSRTEYCGVVKSGSTFVNPVRVNLAVSDDNYIDWAITRGELFGVFLADTETNPELIELAHNEGWIHSTVDEVYTDDVVLRALSSGDVSPFSSVTHLDELQYCTGLTIPAYCFNNCTSLTSITLDNGAVVNSTAFNGCTNISVDCTNVEKIVIDSGSTWQNTHLTKIITSKFEVAEGHQSLTVTEDKNGLLNSNGTELIFANTVLTMPDSVNVLKANSLPDRKAVTIPMSISTIENGAFNGSTLDTVIFHKPVPITCNISGNTMYVPKGTLSDFRLFYGNNFRKYHEYKNLLVPPYYRRDLIMEEPYDWQKEYERVTCVYTMREERPVDLDITIGEIGGYSIYYSNEYNYGVNGQNALIAAYADSDRHYLVSYSGNTAGTHTIRWFSGKTADAKNSYADERISISVNSATQLLYTYNVTERTSTNNDAYHDSDYKFRILCNRYIGNSNANTTFHIYELEFYGINKSIPKKENIYVSRIYPVIRKSDSTPGLYDEVRKRFFVPENGGTFRYASGVHAGDTITYQNLPMWGNGGVYWAGHDVQQNKCHGASSSGLVTTSLPLLLLSPGTITFNNPSSTYECCLYLCNDSGVRKYNKTIHVSSTDTFEITNAMWKEAPYIKIGWFNVDGTSAAPSNATILTINWNFVYN